MALSGTTLVEYPTLYVALPEDVDKFPLRDAPQKSGSEGEEEESSSGSESSDGDSDSDSSSEEESDSSEGEDNGGETGGEMAVEGEGAGTVGAVSSDEIRPEAGAVVGETEGDSSGENVPSGSDGGDPASAAAVTTGGDAQDAAEASMGASKRALDDGDEGESQSASKRPHNG